MAEQTTTVVRAQGAGATRSVIIQHAECCTVCGMQRDSLGNHHIFGRTIPMKIRCCVQCHADFHGEVDRRQPGAAVVAMLRAVIGAIEPQPVEPRVAGVADVADVGSVWDITG